MGLNSVTPNQYFPTKPVRIIEPFGLGGGPDIVARILSPKLSELWGQPVTVENRPGNGSTEAPALVARSTPDGHTLLVNTSAQAYSAASTKPMPYDPIKDFIPVAPLTSQPYVLVTGNAARITSLRELIEAAKAKPGELRFGSTGMGTGTHLGIERFNLAAGIKATHDPPQAGDAISNVLARTIAGQTTYMMAPIQLALVDIDAGHLCALGVTSKTRSPLLPDVPTVSEAAIPNFAHPIWYGVWAPAGTRISVVEKISQDVTTALAAPEVRNRLANHGANTMSMSRLEFAHFVQNEAENAAAIIKSAEIAL